MLNSSPASTTQIVAVTGAVLLILGLGSAAVANRVLTWTGLGPQQTSETEAANSAAGENEVEQNTKG